MSTLVSTCHAVRRELRGGGFVAEFEVAFTCWLPDGHQGPHWAIVSRDIRSEREPVAWIGSDTSVVAALPGTDKEN